MAATQVKSETAPRKRRKTAKPAPKKAQAAPKKVRPSDVKSPNPSGGEWEPTQDQRNLVILSSALGWKQAQICEMLGVASPKTLMKHCKHEYANGRDLVMTKIAGTLVSIATDRQHKGCVTAAIFLSKVWGKMREPEPEWSENKRKAALEDEDGVGDIIIEAELVLEEPRPEPLGLPSPTVQ